MAEHLSTPFHDLKVSRSTVYHFMRSECNLSLKKADFHSMERNSLAKIEETTRLGLQMGGYGHAFPDELRVS